MNAIGSTLRAYLPLTDASGALVTGKAAFFAVSVAKHGDLTTATPSSITEIGTTGVYTYTIVATVVGKAFADALYGESGHPTQAYHDEWDVVTAAQADPVTALLSRGVTLSAPLNVSTGTLTLVKGNAYTIANGLAPTFDATGFPTLVGATVLWRAIREGRTRLTKAMTVVDADTCRCELTSDDTDHLRVGATYTYEVQETAPSEITIATGALVVQAS